jgi:hypothetical protein
MKVYAVRSSGNGAYFAPFFSSKEVARGSVELSYSKLPGCRWEGDDYITPHGDRVTVGEVQVFDVVEHL